MFDQALPVRREKKDQKLEGEISDLIQFLPDFPSNFEEF